MSLLCRYIKLYIHYVHFYVHTVSCLCLTWEIIQFQCSVFFLLPTTEINIRLIFNVAINIWIPQFGSGAFWSRVGKITAVLRAVSLSELSEDEWMYSELLLSLFVMWGRQLAAIKGSARGFKGSTRTGMGGSLCVYVHTCVLLSLLGLLLPPPLSLSFPDPLLSVNKESSDIRLHSQPLFVPDGLLTRYFIWVRAVCADSCTCCMFGIELS